MAERTDRDILKEHYGFSKGLPRLFDKMSDEKISRILQRLRDNGKITDDKDNS